MQQARQILEDLKQVDSFFNALTKNNLSIKLQVEGFKTCFTHKFAVFRETDFPAGINVQPIHTLLQQYDTFLDHVVDRAGGFKMKIVGDEYRRSKRPSRMNCGCATTLHNCLHCLQLESQVYLRAINAAIDKVLERFKMLELVNSTLSKNKTKKAVEQPQMEIPQATVVHQQVYLSQPQPIMYTRAQAFIPSM